MAKKKVLYVEDEPFLAKVVKESLESRDFKVTLVEDGESVARTFDDINPDICVLDVMLPHRDGFSLAKDIRAKNSDIPIIFLTAKTQTRDLLQGFNSGGNDYLKKPFSMEELIVRINNLLTLTYGSKQKNTEKKKEKIVLGKYTFYPRRYELHHKNKIRKLSHRETLLLSLLTSDMENPVLREEILLSIWGDDSFYNSRNLDVYISKLRDYLSLDTEIQITTLKGIGYKFTKK